MSQCAHLNGEVTWQNPQKSSRLAPDPESVLNRLTVIHRYLGIVLAVPMLAWCISGFVMMWVSYPNVDTRQRVDSLPLLSLASCCELAALRASLGDVRIEAFQIEMLADSPILRLEMAGNQRLAFDLVRGISLTSVDLESAERISKAFMRSARLSGVPDPPRSLTVDQWTVSGDFDLDRPLYRVALNDANSTEIYISSRTGKVVQQTTVSQRVGNYFGAITHWIYPAMLRYGHPVLWNWIIIALSTAGGLLTLLGITLGVARARWRAGQKISPWSGWRMWHHTFGLIFGLLTLAWVGSGLLSMNPGGVLASDYGASERAEIAGSALTVNDAIEVVQRLTNSHAVSPPQPGGVRQIASAPLGGGLYLLETSADQRRLDPATFESVPMASDEVRHALAPVGHEGAIDFAYLPQGDDYLFTDHKRPMNPVYRAILPGDGSRYYLDALSGALIAKFDAPARHYRWWFEAPHRWDFISRYRAGPLWDLVVSLLLLGVTLSVGSGAVLGLRRLMARQPTV